MLFDVDLSSGKPVYQQMVDQVKLALASGQLKAGDKLPSVRDVAVAVRVNRNTVARVYKELETEGIVYSRPGQGSFVSDKGSRLSEEVQREHLTQMIDELLTQARLYGIENGELTELLQQREREVFQKSQQTNSRENDHE